MLSVKNGVRHLAQSIESVLDQQVDLELHVYDNGSADGSLELARGYLGDPRVRVTQNPPGLTFPDSMNLGLAATEAELFCAWACDDAMLPGNLAAKAAVLEETGAGLAIGGWMYEGDGGELRGVSWPAMGGDPRLVPAPGLFPMIATANAIAMPSVVMRTEALRAVGGFDTRPELTCDWLLWLRLALRESAVWLPKPLVLYRQHADNGSSRAWARGTYATELVATVEQALADDRFPAEWAGHREGILTGVATFLADGLERHGHRSLADSPYPAHAAIAGVLASYPGSARLRGLYRRAVTDAGLIEPELPAVAVAAPRWEPDAVSGTVGELRRLSDGGLTRACQVAVANEDLDRAVALLEAALADDPELEIDLVVCDEPAELYRPGALFVSEWGAEAARDAEAAGIPAVTFGMPTPYDRAA